MAHAHSAFPLMHYSWRYPMVMAIAHGAWPVGQLFHYFQNLANKEGFMGAALSAASAIKHDLHIPTVMLARFLANSQLNIFCFN